MNKPVLVNLSKRVEANAVRILRDVPGLEVVVAPNALDSGRDALVKFGPDSGALAIEFKKRANPATAWQLVNEARDKSELPLLLIAEETSERTREILEEHSISFVDGLGNSHIELPGILIHTAAPKAEPKQHGKTQLSGKSGVVAQALLLSPDREWKVKDLANESEVSEALAHRVLVRLEKEGIVDSHGRGPARVRTVIAPRALLDVWVEETSERANKVMAYLLAQTSEQLIHRVSERLAQARIEHAITGAAAARSLAPFVTSIPVVETWVTNAATPDELKDALRAELVVGMGGENVVLKQAKNDTPLAFKELRGGIWTANRFRVYADLRATPQRGPEQAEHLREEVIGF